MEDKLKEEVKTKVLQLINGQTLEKNKFEVKSKWYDLSSKKKSEENKKDIPNHDYYEFLKDCTSIANSYGGENGFIVIGISESKDLVDTNIKDSHLTDPSQIKDVIIGNIDKPFLIDIDYIDVNGKKLSVIHIPPSTDKPHLVTEYWSKSNHKQKGVIFCRNGSGAEIAQKANIDLMYWERGNIFIERKLNGYISRHNMEFHISSTNHILFNTTIIFESLGNRDISLEHIIVTFILKTSMEKFNHNRFLLLKIDDDENFSDDLFFVKGEFSKHSYTFHNEQHLEQKDMEMYKGLLESLSQTNGPQFQLTLEGIQSSGESLLIDTKLTFL